MKHLFAHNRADAEFLYHKIITVLLGNGPIEVGEKDGFGVGLEGWSRGMVEDRHFGRSTVSPEKWDEILFQTNGEMVATFVMVVIE